MCWKVEKFDSGRTPDLFKVHFCHSAARWQPGRAARTQHSVGQTQERPFKKESSSLQARISCMSQSEAFIFAALQAFADVWVQYCLCLPCRLLLSLLILNHICSFLDIWMLKPEVFRCSFSMLWHVGGQSSDEAPDPQNYIYLGSHKPAGKQWTKAACLTGSERLTRLSFPPLNTTLSQYLISYSQCPSCPPPPHTHTASSTPALFS